MVEQILMAASGVITLSSCYVAWHYAKQAQTGAELLAWARSKRNELQAENDHHPTEKLVQLMRAIIEWTRGTVADPFMGSGLS